MCLTEQSAVMQTFDIELRGPSAVFGHLREESHILSIDFLPNKLVGNTFHLACAFTAKRAKTLVNRFRPVVRLLDRT
jgi:hypothetical protein